MLATKPRSLNQTSEIDRVAMEILRRQAVRADRARFSVRRWWADASYRRRVTRTPREPLMMALTRLREGAGR